jgi:hypothetical protein
MAQSVAGTIVALTDACVSIYADVVGPDEQAVLVSPGAPGQYQPAAIVAVGWEVRTPITRPTMGAGRSRDTQAEIDVLMSVWVPGDETAQPVANTAVYALLALLETYLRTSPNEVLGGACRDSYVSNAVLQPDITYEATDDPSDEPVPTGRVASLTVTVTTIIRY